MTTYDTFVALLLWNPTSQLTLY